MSDDAIGAIIGLFVLAMVLPIILLWWILKFLWEHREEIDLFLSETLAPLLEQTAVAIWEAHLALGAAAVQAMREWPVRLLSGDCG